MAMERSLPTGYRFYPTDEELVVGYLMRRVCSVKSLPTGVIVDADIYKHDPGELLARGEEEKYFFTRRMSKHPRGKKANRTCVSGYWRATGKDKAVVSSRRNLIVGMKKTLVFYKGRAPMSTKTPWIMHEYRLSGVAAQLCPTLESQGPNKIPVMLDWVLCRIRLRVEPIKLPTFIQLVDGPKEEAETSDKNRMVIDGVVLFDFMKEIKAEGVTDSISTGTS